jgi:hypothetical protein
LLFVPLVGALLALLAQLLIDRIVVAGDSDVEITSGLDETFDWLEVLEIDCVGDKPALPMVEWPSEPTDGACGYGW